MRVPRSAPATLLALALLLAAAPAVAQGFGKNKVQYEPLDWAVLETPHLRLHYYAEEESLARRLTVFAESVCVEYDRRFSVKPRTRVPFLLYSVHHLFQQTNASEGFISEGVGGLTELIKGRVLLPHPGSWKRLEWVTRHELTHWYMLEKLSQVMRMHKRAQSYMPPLWFTEGFAEYCGTTWDADAEGLLRDAVLSGEAVPLTHSDSILGTVLMYKEGQSFLLFLAQRFGSEKVFDLFDNWWRADDFSTVFEMTFGVKLKDLDRDWFRSLKRRYYPVVATAEKAEEAGRRLTRHGRFNLGARVIPSADPSDTSVSFCYFEVGEGTIDLVVNTPGPKPGTRRDRRLLRGHQSAQFESFHLFTNRPDATSSGTIVLSSKRGGRDAIYLVDSRSGHVERRFDFPDLVAIHDPSLAPGDRAVVFSAQDYGGRSDLYRVTWPNDVPQLERLTDDDYDDLEPDVSPDGRWVAFASDRCNRGGEYSLFRLSLEDGHIETVSDPERGSDRQPVYSPDGRWIAFRSTRDGISDLYLRPSEPSREARRVTRLYGPATDPTWLSDSRGLLFTAEEAITFNTYRVNFDPDTLRVEGETPGPSSPAVPVAVFEEPAKPYQRRIGLDLVQNAVGVDPGLGGAGGAGQVALSDLLGNEQYYIYLANDSDRFGGSFWDGFEGGLTYINRARRLNYGVGVFRLTQVYDADLDLVRREKRVGVLGLAIYPFDKFTRIEGSVLARHASDHLLRSGLFTDVDLVSNFLTLVHDNTSWTYLGPTWGRRMYLSAGYTRDLTSGAADYGTLLADVRAYRLLLPQVVSATRVLAQASLGRDAQNFYLGGPFSLRGYDRRTLFGQRTVMAQQEVRFPLLRGLVIAVPSPWMVPSVGAVAFADVAWAWEGGVPQRLGSLGVGWYVGGGYYPAVGAYYAWPTTDFRRYSKGPRTQFRFSFNF